jgi:hypothetical protein
MNAQYEVAASEVNSNTLWERRHETIPKTDLKYINNILLNLFPPKKITEQENHYRSQAYQIRSISVFPGHYVNAFKWKHLDLPHVHSIQPSQVEYINLKHFAHKQLQVHGNKANSIWSSAFHMT